MDNDLDRAVSSGSSAGLRLRWSAVFAGALAAAALSLILISFGAAIGLAVSSSSPSWRDASAALALLSGLYLILEASLSFGVGGYIAGRAQRMAAQAPVDTIETSDGIHGLTAWALGVILGGAVVALVGLSGAHRAIDERPSATPAEPLLSYELDRLYRSPRRPTNVDINFDRAEAGRVLLTSSGHNGVSSEDRSYLIQQVAAAAGVSAADAEKRVDNAVEEARTAISRSRRSSIILAFSIAAALLFGAAAAWAGACTGGRHRDGTALPAWAGTRSTAAEPVV